MKFEQELRKRAKSVDANIVLAEANMDKRVYDACKYILKHRLSKITVFGKRSQFDEDFNSEDCTIIDLSRTKLIGKFAEQLYELRKDKIESVEVAKEMVKQPNYFACMLIRNEMADGAVMGAKFTTKDAIKPALQIIKTPKDSKVSGLILLIKDNIRPIILSDVSLQIKPTADELSGIALDAGKFMDKALGIKPRIAMLSYSTHGSGQGESVDLVKNATEMLKQKCDYIVDGEIQADSALNKQTGSLKKASSEVAGKANVLIVPDINAGNIGYKLLAELGGFEAVGPIMVGLNSPVNDLSRGCTKHDIINTVCITKLQTKIKNV